MGKQSRAKRRRRETETPESAVFREAMESAPCLLCGAPAVAVGVWAPTARIARFLGAESLAYTLCERCAVEPGVQHRVEDSILSFHAGHADPAPDPGCLDTAALARVATPEGFATFDGEMLIMLRPLTESEDHMVLDKAICAAGLKKFLRPITRSDQPDPSRAVPGSGPDPGPFVGTHMLVEEMAPGIRRRMAVEYYPPGRLN